MVGDGNGNGGGSCRVGRGVLCGSPLDRVREARMEVPPIPLDQLGFEHFGIQRMVEPECAVVDDGHERAGVHGRLQPDQNPAGILTHDLRELVRVRRPAADREHRGKSPRRRRRPEPRLQHR